MAEQLVLVAAVEDAAEADWLRQTLEAGGLSVFICAQPALAGAASRVQLLVGPAEADDAARLIEAYRMRNEALAKPPEASDSAWVYCYCPHCGGSHRWPTLVAGTGQRCIYCGLGFLAPADLEMHGTACPQRFSPGSLRGWLADRLPRATGVPRRFNVGAMMAMTALFGIAFATLNSVDAHPAVYVFVSILIGGVGLAQMFLYEGKNPRYASVLAGAVLSPLVLMGIVFALNVGRGHLDGMDLMGLMIVSAVFGVIGGIFFGYLAGALAAGVFLLIERFAGRHGGDPPSDAPPAAAAPVSAASVSPDTSITNDAPSSHPLDESEPHG